MWGSRNHFQLQATSTLSRKLRSGYQFSSRKVLLCLRIGAWLVFVRVYIIRYGLESKFKRAFLRGAWERESPERVPKRSLGTRGARGGSHAGAWERGRTGTSDLPFAITFYDCFDWCPVIHEP